MCLAGAGAILSAGTSIFGAIAGNAAANKQKWENAAYQKQVEAQQEKYRADLMEYNNVVYESNIEYRDKVLEYQKTEWDRQVDFVEDQTERSEENYFTKLGALLTQAFEQQIADTFQIQSTEAQGRSARATTAVSTGERNIDGNTARALENDLFRQEGEAKTTIDLNRQSRDRQLALDTQALGAEHYSKVTSLQLQADAPLAPIATPSPVAPVTPAQQVSKGSNLALIANVAGSVVSGISGVMKANNLKF